MTNRLSQATAFYSILWCFIIVLIAKNPVSAQCSGSVLFKETFGGNSSSPAVGPALDSGVTTYQYIASGDIQDGDYSIKKVTGPMFNWFANGTDHTGNGYMMIVNASYDPGKFYEKEVDNLCQGSHFYFSAWIANLLPQNQYSQTPLDPGVRFEIRSAATDSVLATFSTGLIKRYNSFTWTQFGIPFSLPAGESSIILAIYNDQPGGNGNDLALDDIEFKLCGPAINTSYIGTYKDSSDVCINNSVTIKAKIDTGYYSHPVYQWQFSQDGQNWNDITGATDTLYHIAAAAAADSGLYRILVAEQGNINSPNCREASNPVPLNVYQPKTTIITSNTPICAGSDLHLSTIPALLYNWQYPNGSFSSDSAIDISPVQLSDEGTYQLQLITSGGCYSSGSANINIQPNNLKLNLGNDTTVCAGNTVSLNAYNTGASYQWNTGNTTPQLIVDSPGLYAVTATSGICSRSDSIMISYITKPAVNLGMDTTACLYDSVLLNAYSPIADKYTWQDGAANPQYIVTQPGIYRVNVSNQCGSASDSVTINFEQCSPQLVVPTAFTPNGDGVNDLFIPRQTFYISNYEMRVFNRWGQLVFATKNIDQGWNGNHDGHPCPMGGYIWEARYKKKDGNWYYAKGSVILIR